MNILKSFIIKIVPKRLKTFLGRDQVALYKKGLNHAAISYSQEGEDLVINRFLGQKKKGFYIDIGAHHPKRFSNTYMFYRLGWRGINIDAMPGSMQLFEEQRPKDINLELGVSKQQGELLYYMFNEPALNTFSESEAIKKDGLRNYKIIEKRPVTTYPLVEILDKHISREQVIDFMSIDVEGLELDVVVSNDWEKYRPQFILVEDLKKYALSDLPHKSELYKEFMTNDYEFVAKTFNTLFFKDSRS
jgi:FkbM family methyltransferase